MSGTSLLDQMEKDRTFYGSQKTNQLELLKNVIRDFNGYDVYKTELYIDHDGYDKYGPKSDIIDLVIWVKTPEETYEVWSYHTEEWFLSRDGPPPFVIDAAWKISEELWTSTMNSLKEYRDYWSLTDRFNKFMKENGIDDADAVPDCWRADAHAVHDEDDGKEEWDDGDGCPCGCDQISSWMTGSRNCRTIVCTYEGDYVPANHEAYNICEVDGLSQREIAEFECECAGYMEER